MGVTGPEKGAECLKKEMTKTSQIWKENGHQDARSQKDFIWEQPKKSPHWDTLLSNCQQSKTKGKIWKQQEKSNPSHARESSQHC